LLNGGFESGAYQWQTYLTYQGDDYGAEFLVYDPVNSWGGDYYAELGGYSGGPYTQHLDYDWAYRIPSSVTGDFAISFWTAFITGTTPGTGTLQVVLTDIDAQQTTTVATIQSSSMRTGVWTQFTYPLPIAAYGKRIQLGFRATQNGSDWIGFPLDDIAMIQAPILKSSNLDPNHLAPGDVLDLAVLAGAWGGKSTEGGFVAAADLNDDGVVDDNDVRIFLAR
jgi:hypothetical protein